MSYSCEHCQSIFISKYILNKHINTAKYCLKLRGISELEFKCSDCNKTFSRKHHLSDHIKICVKKDINDNNKKFILQIEDKDRKLEEKDVLIRDLKQQIKDLQDKLENIAIKAVSRPFEDETTIDIEEDSDNNSGEYKLTPLEVGKGYTIEHRDEDGYINVTHLCKAGNKKFTDWFRLDKTKAFLQALYVSAGIPVDTLIKYNTAYGKERATWSHPQVAINIAQWISPRFDVKVSAWVYEVMMTGKVDISNTKSYRQLQSENKNKELKIQYLTKKYVKSQPRIQYEERNVVYILTTKLMKKDRRYILGKATDLTSRLSTYNKSDEHKVVYFGSCGDEETMNLVENMVFQLLKEYREQANRERFVLPEKEKIELFSNVIKKSIEFFKK